MDRQRTPLEENRRLRRTMRDLVALSTLPAVWTGLGPDGIARSLADVLLNTLSLDLVYVRLAGLAGRGRGRGRPQQAPPRRRPRRGGEGGRSPRCCGPTAAEPPAAIPDPFGAGTLHVAVTRFGVGDDHGVLVAGSRSADFPTERDRLLLGVGANQTAIVVQRRRAEEALRESEQRFARFMQHLPGLAWIKDARGPLRLRQRGRRDGPSACPGRTSTARPTRRSSRRRPPPSSGRTTGGRWPAGRASQVDRDPGARGRGRPPLARQQVPHPGPGRRGGAGRRDGHRHHRPHAGGGGAAGGRPAQGRVPGDAGPRAAQPAGPDPQRPADPDAAAGDDGRRSSRRGR